MTVRRLALMIRGSMLLIAATVLAACGGGSGGSGGGAAQVTVPNVVGDTQAAATTAITGAGLTVGTATQQLSSTVASGHVISESPVASTSVASGSAVALVVSIGPPQPQTIGGTLIGLAPSATVHVLNGADNVAISANGSFTLPTTVLGGETYSVTVGTPTSTQTCAVQDGSGTVASAKVTNVVVYCTYNVSTATLNDTYTVVAADFNTPSAGTTQTLDDDGTSVYNGAGSINTTSTANVGGTIQTGLTASGTYAVATTNAIPSLTGSAGGSGGIEGVNGVAAGSVGTTSGAPSSIGIAVLPNATATTASIDGNYTLVQLSAQLTTGNIYGYEGTITLTNGNVTGTYTENGSGTITTGIPAGALWTVTSGIVTSVAQGAGAVSADGDLIVLADTHTGDDPFISVAVPQGTGVTPATFEGVYSVAQYGGLSITATFGKAITLFAHGDGTYSIIFTKNAQGTITTNNTDEGTYTVAADGTLALTDSEGNSYNGGISADGNALALGSVTSNQSPTIFVGIRQ
jgi:hypothetical protein